MTKKLLVISNNVLSNTNNNGKTILSFIDGLKDVSVFQLYMSGEVPRLKGYDYFRISDKDILFGLFSPSRRGGIVKAVPLTDKAMDDFSIRKTVGRNHYTLAARDLLWHGKWRSDHLKAWLNKIQPDAIFFMAGDTLFSYEIASYIQKAYLSRLTIYVTDDYIMPRQQESLMGKIRRKHIIKAMKQIISQASCFYTICEPMREAYLDLLGVDSILAVNMTKDLISKQYRKKEKEIILTYAGSFYYRREVVLVELAMSLERYNKQYPDKPAKLMLYSNQEPEEETKRRLCIDSASEYGGSLDSEQLRVRLNTSDILVFVESFDPVQVEKVKYSLSTKIPEYMSVGKAILVIGPDGIGSISYLKDVSAWVSAPEELDQTLFELLRDSGKREGLGKKSREKFLEKHNRDELQRSFENNVFGNGVDE